MVEFKLLVRAPFSWIPKGTIKYIWVKLGLVMESPKPDTTQICNSSRLWPIYQNNWSKGQASDRKPRPTRPNWLDGQVQSWRVRWVRHLRPVPGLGRTRACVSTARPNLNMPQPSAALPRTTPWMTHNLGYSWLSQTTVGCHRVTYTSSELFFLGNLSRVTHIQ